MKRDDVILVRGGGDLATGTIHRLWSAGLKVLVLEAEHPAAIRRQVSVSEAVYEGGAVVEGMRAALVKTLDEAVVVWQRGDVPVMVDPKGELIPQVRPAALVDAILAKGLKGEAVSKEEELKFKTAFMLFVGREYHKLDWAMQLHYGCKRDNNTLMFEKLGPDTGYDCINNYAPSAQMADFLNALIVSDELPRTVIYSLNPNDNQAIGTILGCFQDSTAVAKIQQGSAWWFNDHKTGMQDQMISLANLGNLSGFVGMLTDSRSFLSYTRHEYFRRILCNLIGNWVESGEFPADYDTLSEIVTDISYNNAKRYFKFPLA